MKQKKTIWRIRMMTWLVAAVFATVSIASGGMLSAQTKIPPPGPKSGSVGLEGTISSPPPSRAATITTPVNGRAFTSTPITVNGLCPQGTMVKLFSNNIFVGSVRCTNGSYSLQIDLFSGANDLVARVFDDLDQAGPDSNIVRVTFNDAQFNAFSSRVTLTSNYARLGANPSQTISWPIILSGGVGPYAISVDWGDGKPLTLKSIPFAGNFNVDHIYDSAGVYRIIVKATDANGLTGYLQLIGVANGEVKAAGVATKDGTGSTTVIKETKYSLMPSLIALPLILATFWLGRKYEIQRLRRRIEQTASAEYSA
ncbi:MAG TPA: hypothetical protein VK983_01185 [Candidatus Limnocylindrales bacterium]|nr:hypothetical protein [Candidatus Limnocylindrales bacterium]